MIALDFKSKLTDPALAAFAINVLTRMQGDPQFASVKDLVDSDLKAASDRYSLALQEAADGSRKKIAEKRNAAEALINVLDTIAGHVNILAKGDESVVYAAGFRVRGFQRKEQATVEMVNGLSLSSTVPGEVVVKFSPVANAVMYKIEWRTEEETNWHDGSHPSSSRMTLKGLPNHTEVLVRACALGTLERQGPPCLPAKVFVQ